jgi:hypothetical protein
MIQERHINLKIPIFSWLFFLFLSSGISHYHNNIQFGKQVQIERVDQLISNSSKKKSVAEFLTVSEKSILHQKLDLQFLQINLLSEKLDNYVRIALKRQICLFKEILQNLIIYLRSRNLAFNSSDDFLI